MKYENTVLWLALLLGASVAACQEIAENHYEFKVEVTDDFGKPVADASVTASKDVLQTVRPVPSSKSVWVANSTDDKGIASFEFKSVHSPGGILVKKDGYYDSTVSASWQRLDGTPGFRTEISTILKPVKKPIPMVFFAATGMVLKEVGVDYKFDFLLGEALPPHGKGEVGDLLIRLEETKVPDGSGGEVVSGYKAVVRFTNSMDGVVEFASQPRDGARGSTLVSGYQAPEDGYVQMLERTIGADVGRTAEQWEYIHSLKRIGYYFRIRTKTDGDGRIVSARYGKMYGPLELAPFARKGRPAVAEPGKMGLSFEEVYFNPTPNDRNVECDPSVNLLEKSDKSGNAHRIERP